MRKTLLSLACLLAGPALANEGQWQPHQLKALSAELGKLGLDLPADLSDLSKPPMSAIVSTGGCSASFVSPQGLIVTNHHCAYAAIQRNSTAEKNLLAKGFLARGFSEELPAGPNERVYVTESVSDVSAQVLGALGENLRGEARHEAIQTRIKSLVADCEKDPAYRCSAPAFHRGAQYFLIKQLMIRDVRLVYAPAEMIGNYGGDEDNFEWPRHTGDFAFLRAYVGKDGRPAEPSPDNVPYTAKDFLSISTAGLKAGDPILLLGYPGKTSRYKLPSEVRFAKDWDYPNRIAEYRRDLAAIAKAVEGQPESALRYASVVKGINNRMKKLEGLLTGFARQDILGLKTAQHDELRGFLANQAEASMYRKLLADLESLVAEDQALSREELHYELAKGSELLKSAIALHRLAIEGEKPDAEREMGFQDRDRPLLKARLTRLEQNLVPAVDQARWLSALERYSTLPAAERIPGFDQAFGLGKLQPPKALPRLYARTELAETPKRLAWLDKKPADFAASPDPLIQLAVALHDTELALERRRKAVDGEFERLVPRYMNAVIAWKRSQNLPVYADANGTLRITYGTVDGYTPRDGQHNLPFTTAKGILEKHTGTEPFAAPAPLRQAVAAGRYGRYADPTLRGLPVNFLSSADTTGGNSGSAILNAKGELVGLNFDSTYESVTKDWYYDPANTRAIHVDARYMLWVMEQVDEAGNVLKELSIH